ncbi:MAG: hypothetical protein J2P43_06960 [Candidatus Dormibacteraeota bacterium]|nr:hypothetical protein [Candidatus Dormibacteraeota bacterium]
MPDDERVVRGVRAEVTVRYLAPGQQPPPAQNRVTVYDGIVEAMRERPDCWVYLEHVSPSTGTELRRRGCEVHERRNGDHSRRDLYVRLRPDGPA